jgi:mono/diheme cytochrome c family protein
LNLAGLANLLAMSVWEKSVRQKYFLLLVGVASAVALAQPALAQNQDLIARGSYLANGSGACGNCHTQKGPDLMPKANMVFAGGERFESPGFGVAYSKNLTSDPETGIGTWTETEIIHAFREGVAKEGNTLGPPMPVPYFNKMSDDDAKAIAAYVKSLKPIRNEVPESQYKIELRPQPQAKGLPAPAKTDKIAYGAYLATMSHCVECHTTPGPDGKPDFAGHLAAGGRPFFPIPGKMIRSANITSDVETGIGGWTDDEVKRAITEGINKSGKKLIPPMPYPFFKNMNAEDLDAVVAWVRTLPPVNNKNPPNPPLGSYLQ